MTFLEVKKFQWTDTWNVKKSFVCFNLNLFWVSIRIKFKDITPLLKDIWKMLDECCSFWFFLLYWFSFVDPWSTIFHVSFLWIKFVVSYKNKNNFYPITLLNCQFSFYTSFQFFCLRIYNYLAWYLFQNCLSKAWRLFEIPAYCLPSDLIFCFFSCKFWFCSNECCKGEICSHVYCFRYFKWSKHALFQPCPLGSWVRSFGVCYSVILPSTTPSFE